LEFLWVFQEVDHFFDFFFGLVATGHIGKGHLVVVFIQHARFALAKAECTAFAATLHLAHEVHPHTNQQQHGAPADQQSHQERAFFTGLHIKFHAVGDEVTHQAAVEVGCCCTNLAIVIGDRRNFCAALTFLDGGTLDAFATNLF